MFLVVASILSRERQKVFLLNLEYLLCPSRAPTHCLSAWDEKHTPSMFRLLAEENETAEPSYEEGALWSFPFQYVTSQTMNKFSLENKFFGVTLGRHCHFAF